MLICFRGIGVTVTRGHTCVRRVTFTALLVMFVRHFGGELSVGEGTNIQPNQDIHTRDDPEAVGVPSPQGMGAAVILPLCPWSWCLFRLLGEWLSCVYFFLSAGRNSASQGLKTSSVLYNCCWGDRPLHSSHPVPSFIPNGKGLAPWTISLKGY